MFGLGWQELVIVLVIIMIIFGAGKLPEVAKSLGQGVKEFKQESNAPTDSLAAASASSTDGFDTAASSTSTERARVRADEI
jgi:sec-independent protein translocase protein TatA